MKIALILDAAADSFLQQMQEMHLFLQRSAAAAALNASDCELWLFGHPQEMLRLPAFILPITRVYWLERPHPMLVESCLPQLEQLQQSSAAQLLLFDTRSWGAELATRLAYRLRGASCVNAETAHIDASRCRVQKSVYGNNMLATLELRRSPWCLSVARQGIAVGKIDDYKGAQSDFTSAGLSKNEWLLGVTERPLPTGSALSQALWVLAVGLGVGSADNLQRMGRLADALGAQLATSRPVVMNGWSELAMLLGMSGTPIAPDVCITAGVSGAAAFAVGIRHSQFIVAINTDPQAAIFSQADVGIVDDMNEVLNELVKCIRADRTAEA